MRVKHVGLSLSNPTSSGAGSDSLTPGSKEVSVQQLQGRSYGMLFYYSGAPSSTSVPPLMGLSYINGVGCKRLIAVVEQTGFGS